MSKMPLYKYSKIGIPKIIQNLKLPLECTYHLQKMQTCIYAEKTERAQVCPAATRPKKIEQNMKYSRSDLTNCLFSSIQIIPGS
jgi:hypothetical protein